MHLCNFTTPKDNVGRFVGREVHRMSCRTIILLRRIAGRKFGGVLK